MKKIGIKLADGTFFPILEEGSPGKKEINLTTVKDNQTKVKLDLYRSEKSSIDEAEYLDTLEISKMKKHPNGEPNIGLEISLDENNELSAKIVDKESGAESQFSISLLSKTKNEKNSATENSDEGVALADLPDLDFGAEEAVENDTTLDTLSNSDLSALEEGASEENDGATVEETADTAAGEEESLADDLPSLDEIDLSLSESSEQEDTVTDEALSDSDLSALEGSASEENDAATVEETADTAAGEEETIAEGLPSLDEIDLNLPESSEQEDAVTDEALSDSDLSALEGSASEENDVATVEDAADTAGGEESLADDLPSLDEIDLSLPESSEQEDTLTEETLSLDGDLSLEEGASKENDVEETADTVAGEEESLVDDLPSLDEIDLSLPESSEQEDAIADETLSDSDLSALEEGASEENDVVETVDTAVGEEKSLADDLPSLDEIDLSLPESSEQEDAISDETLSLDDDLSLEEDASQEAAPMDDETSSLEEADLDLPDLDFGAEDSAENDTTLDTSSDSDLSDLDLPDLSFDEPDFFETKNEIQDDAAANDNLNFSDMNFEMPNFDDTNFSSSQEKSSAENSSDSFSDTSLPPAGALDFSDLYDDEKTYNEDSQEKNQKFPVIVCVVCAIICVLALLAILFVAPSRFNLSGKNQTQDLAQELTEDSSIEQDNSELPPPPPPEPVAQVAPPAKEDEIVVIEETKNVVPDFPPPQEKSAPKEIVYKVKWGDTLWDLSAAYYKNPWLYPKIARYNNIKNPDYIIAGSTIRIPEE